MATANFGPLYPGLLAGVQWVLGPSETIAQIAGALLGTSTVIITATMARRLVGDRAALLAATLVALSPMLIAADGSLMSEALYVPLVALAVLFALEAGRHGRWWSWGALGLSIGLAALTRSEALLLLLTLVVPVLWWSPLEVRRRWVGVVGVGVVSALTVLPWVARNQAALGVATLSTVSPATALAGSNCDNTYSGESIGSWEYECTRPEERRTLGEVRWSNELRSDAIGYISDNLAQLPAVLAARELRVWGVWDPADLVRRDVAETRDATFQWSVRITSVLTLLGGTVGIWLLCSRCRAAVVLVGPAAMVATTALLTHGNPRFATVAQPQLLVGVGVCVAVGLGWHRRDAASRTTSQTNQVRLDPPAHPRVTSRPTPWGRGMQSPRGESNS